MPSRKNLRTSKSKKQQEKPPFDFEEGGERTANFRRRPADPPEKDSEVSQTSQAVKEPEPQMTENNPSQQGEEKTQEKIKIEFPGHEWIRRKIPGALELGDEAADIWIKGDFERIHIENPLLRLAVKVGLKKAKQVEKKVLEHPVTEKALVGLFTAGLKAQQFIQNTKVWSRKSKSN